MPVTMGASDPARPLSDDELCLCLAAARLPDACLAAISGGPDSMVLMYALALWRRSRPQAQVLVATVDHGLRREAAVEAVMVGEAARRLDLRHHTLRWSGPHPENGLQEAARDARYALLIQLATECGIGAILTAHTLDDQAETVLMRMARGSGISGLGGMNRRSCRGGIDHLRPFLEIPKTRLVATCQQRGWAFAEDPSNTNARYARTRWRQLAPALAGEGLNAVRLARLAERCRRADAALTQKAEEILQSVCLAARSGDAADGRIVLDGKRLMAEPEELSLRALALALEAVTGASPPRLERLETCEQALRTAILGGGRFDRTLAGAVLSLNRSGFVVIGPEPPRRRGGVNREKMGE